MSEIFKKEILNKRYILTVLIIALFYIMLVAYVINYKLVFSTIIGNYPFFYKIRILSELLWGLRSALSRIDFFLLITTSLLSGFNMALVIRSLSLLRKSGKVKFAAGGGTVLSLVSTGCTSCGFSLLSVLGLGSVFAILPFGNYTLYILSIIFLLFSGFYMLKKLGDERFCSLN